jgi:hypothetical protein
MAFFTVTLVIFQKNFIFLKMAIIWLQITEISLKFESSSQKFNRINIVDSKGVYLHRRMLNFLDTKNWYTSSFKKKFFTPISKCDTWMESLRGIECPQNSFTVLPSIVAKLWAPELPLRYFKFNQEKNFSRFSCMINWCEAYDKWNLHKVISSWNIQ